MNSAPKQRPKYYDLNLAHLPAPGLVSIFHRISGALLFFPIVPALLYLMQATLGSAEGYEHWKGIFSQPLVKLVLAGFVWLYVHHLVAGIRYLLLDVHIGVAKVPAQASAKWVFVLGVFITALILWRIW